MRLARLELCRQLVGTLWPRARRSAGARSARIAHRYIDCPINNVKWPATHFVVNTTDVFSKDPHRGELHATNE